MGLAFSVVFFSQFCFEWKIISSPLDAVVAAVAVVDDDVVVEVVVVVIAAVAASAAGGESIEVADWVVTNQDE